MPDNERDASVLLVIDMQYDFLPGGSLPVQEGDRLIPVINRLMPRFPLVVATQDWHPAGHVSFASRYPGKSPGDTVDLPDGTRQFLWPDHCVQDTRGAELDRKLDRGPIRMILRKGSHPDLDSYSAFFENDRKTPTGLGPYLQGLGIRNVYLCGVAEDVCVFFSARDAVQLGFETMVIADAARGVDQPEGGLRKAREQMEAIGVSRIRSEDIERSR